MEKCHDCGEAFKRAGTHWARSGCSYPEYTTCQKEIVRGLLLGDGRMDHGGIEIGSTSLKFLEWVAYEMGFECKNPSFVHVTDAGSDYYALRIRKHPYIERFADWAGIPSNSYPPEIRVTPLVMAVWYAGDGYYHPETKCAEIGVTATSAGRESVLDGYLKQVGLKARIGHDRIHFRRNETRELLRNIPEIPGYGFKWGRDKSTVSKNLVSF